MSRRTPFALVVLLSLWMLFSPGSTVRTPARNPVTAGAAADAAADLVGVALGMLAGRRRAR